MKIHLKVSSLKSKPTKTAVVYVAQKHKTGKGEKAELSFWGASDAFRKLATEAHHEKIFDGKFCEVHFARKAHVDGFDHVLFIGMGTEKNLSVECFRKASATILNCLKSQKITDAGILFTAPLAKVFKGEEAAQAIAEGLVLSSYSFDEFKKKKEPAPAPITIHFLYDQATTQKALISGVEVGEVIGEYSNVAKWLGDMPGNKMTPTILANHALAAAKGTNLKVTVWDKARIKKENMGCLIGVSNGSDEEPRFIIMEYNGGAKSSKPICFVGKGLTFDSGGISIKPAANMEEMKFDMCGGANVIATMLAISKLKLKINVVGLVASSENMPGPSANKPGDITIARNGKSVEVNNTDAEGRLILADALSYASELKPSCIFDIATLTGAMVISLGDLHTGFFSRNDKLVGQIKNAAKTAGERVWQLPLVDEHYEDMKGTYADLSNISSNKGAGSAHGAAFLEQFVGEDIPWAHFDIAGTGWHVGHRLPYCPKRGASAVMVRTFIAFAMQAK